MDHQDARFLDLLRKWQSGDFTRRDEQEMQALTESDDFRRETWQGFQGSLEADHEADLTSLRNRLRQHTEVEEMRAPVAAPRRPLWMAAAAAIAVLLLAVFFLRKNSTPTEEYTPVAVQEAPTPTQSDISSAAEQPGIQPNLPAPTQPQRTADKQPDDSAPSSPAYAHSDDSPVSRQPGGTVATESAASSNTDIADLGVDIQRSAVKEAEPHKRKEEPAVADKAGEQKKASATRPLPAASRSKADTLWSPTGTPPDMAKRREAARDALLPPQSGPADSWEAFQDYLRQTARLTPLAKEKGVSGTVRLQFTVSENGEPQGFLTLRSVGYGCDQEAIRLVKDWVWVRGQNPVVVVEIPFVQ